MKISYLFLCFQLMKPTKADDSDTDFMSIASNDEEVQQPFNIFAMYKKGKVYHTSCLENIGFDYVYKFDELAKYTYTAPANIYCNYEEITIKIVYKNLEDKKIALLNIRTSPNIKIKNNDIFEFVLVLERSKHPYFIEITNVTAFEYEKISQNKPNLPDTLKVKSPFIYKKHKTNVVIDSKKLADVVFVPEKDAENEKRVVCELLKKIKDVLEITQEDLKNDFKKLARIVESNALRCRLRCLYQDWCIDVFNPFCGENVCIPNNTCSNKCYDYVWIRQNITHIRNRQYFEVYLTALERSRLGCGHNIIPCNEVHDIIPNKQRYRIYYDPECKDPEYMCLAKIANELANKYENDLLCGKYVNNQQIDPRYMYQYPLDRTGGCNIQQGVPYYGSENNICQQNNSRYLDGNNQIYNSLNGFRCGYVPNEFNSNGTYQPFDCSTVNNQSRSVSPYDYSLSYMQFPNNQYLEEQIGDRHCVPQKEERDINYLSTVQAFVKNVIKAGLLLQQGYDQNIDAKNNLDEKVIAFVQKTKEIRDIELLQYFLEVLCLCNIKYDYPEYKVLKMLDTYPNKTAIDVKKGLYYETQLGDTYGQILDQTGTSIKALMQNNPALAFSIKLCLDNMITKDTGIGGNGSIQFPVGYSSTCTAPLNVVSRNTALPNSVKPSTYITGAQNLVQPQGFYSSTYNNQFLPQYPEQIPFYIQQQGLYPGQRYPQLNQQAQQPNGFVKPQNSLQNQQPFAYGNYNTRQNNIGMQNMNNSLQRPFVNNNSSTSPYNQAAIGQNNFGAQQPQNQAVVGMGSQQATGTTPGSSTTTVARTVTGAPQSQKTSTIVALPVTGEEQQDLAEGEDEQEDEESEVSEESSDDDATAKKKITPKKKSKISSGAIVAIVITAVSVVVVLAGAIYYFLM